MIHDELFLKFRTMFPVYAEEVRGYYKYGKHALRITTNRNEFIFTYESDKDWSLETVHFNKKENKEWTKKIH